MNLGLRESEEPDIAQSMTTYMTKGREIAAGVKSLSGTSVRERRFKASGRFQLPASINRHIPVYQIVAVATTMYAIEAIVIGS